eukprot:comp20064_c0_seq1/m.24674 comp20064_c0_seq1/g.24674  ORF comp20064_c0_seq1/g.24674 comp20064_c0_seq1/m.24674 type:complete len:447 (-) comp20064_c0_seq1:212-1552(-)
MNSVAGSAASTVVTGLTGPGPHWTGQVHENDPIELVLVCAAALPKMMGSMHPAGSLYEKPVNVDLTMQQHQAFKKILADSGAHVVDVRDVLKMGVDKYLDDRIALEDFAASCLQYTMEEGCDERLLRPEDKFFVGNAYKAKVLEAMSADQLIDIIMTNPKVSIRPSYRDTGFTATYSFEPLSNIVFTRDQQITTKKGIVMARLSSKQRQKEVEVMKFVHKKLGLNVIGEIPEPGRLEGGDFFAAGDLCMIGIGLRSNQEAVDYMMSRDLLGYNRVAVVKDFLESSQDRMHLDTYFSILSHDCVVMLEDCIGEDSPTRRYVDEYARKDENSPYELVKKDVEFSKYVQDEGYTIIPVPGEWQLKYGCNALNLGNNKILCVHDDTARLIARSKAFKGKVQVLNFSDVTAMYGAVHCASQVVRRRSPKLPLHSHEQPSANGVAVNGTAKH